MRARAIVSVLAGAGCLAAGPATPAAPAAPAVPAVPSVIPAQAGIQVPLAELPASAGMTARHPDPDGRAIYVSQCAACHMPDGTGIAGAFPPLAGSDWVTGDERMIVRIVLQGITGEIAVGGERYDGLMPPLGGVLSDAEIAAVASYVRGTWGNEAAAVSTATVARERTATAGRDGPWTAVQLLAGLEIVK